MNNKLRFITMALAAGATAAAITSAPTAFAAEATRACGDGGGATICQNPGNVEIHTEPRIQAPQIYGPFSSPIPFLFN